MSETELYLKIYHYPLNVSRWYKEYDDWRVKRAFYFKPRVFKAGGTTKEALEKVIAFIEEKLSTIEVEIEVEIKVEFETVLEELEMRGSVFLSKELKIKSFNELRELYSRVYSKIKVLYDTEPKIMIEFLRPIKIPLTKEDYRILFEELLNTDAQLNCQTARKLFGKEFAEKISEHNRQIRAKKN
jgi:hypothetical protein